MHVFCAQWFFDKTLLMCVVYTHISWDVVKIGQEGKNSWLGKKTDEKCLLRFLFVLNEPLHKRTLTSQLWLSLLVDFLNVAICIGGEQL